MGAGLTVSESAGQASIYQHDRTHPEGTLRPRLNLEGTPEGHARSAPGPATIHRMSRARHPPPAVLITDAGRGSAIAFIRGLGRRGWRVIAADADVHSPGFRSRYAQAGVVYPHPEEAPTQAVETLLEAVEEHRVDLVIPVTDAIILPLSAARDRFSGLCQLALPEPAALDVVIQKSLTLALAERLGVPVPRTIMVHTAAAALRAVEEAPGLGWPVVLKPQVSRLFRDESTVSALKVAYADTPARLDQEMRRFEGRCPVLLQEYTAGVGLGVELLLYEGRPLAAFQHRRLHEYPVTGGPSALRESVALDPTLYRRSVRLLQALCWTGLAMVEFKDGPRGPLLMEVNGRVWGSLPLAVHAGMDFPARLAELYDQGPPDPQRGVCSDYALGVRSRNLELEVLWIAAVLTRVQPYPFLPQPARREGLRALASLLDPRIRSDILSRQDPRPGLAELWKIARKLDQKLRTAGASSSGGSGADHA
jgi:predicted ATP-grasp superfamily ATP-dependent carboligase